MRRKICLGLMVYLMLSFCLPFMARTAQALERGILVEEKAAQPPSSYKPYEKSLAVVIGIDDYRYWPKLSNAVNDAEAMKDMLEGQGFQVHTLYNREATSQNIRYLLTDDIPRLAGKNDRLLVFYAGHGETRSLPDGNKKGFIVPVEGKKAGYASLIPIDYFTGTSEYISAKHQLFILDSCFSGLALYRTRGKPPSPDIKDYIKNLTRRKARQIIAASTEEQLALDGTTGNSAFTKSLLEAISGGMADFNADGVVTASDLGLYLRDVVSLGSGQYQTPIFGSLSGHQFGDFLFFLGKTNGVVNKQQRRKATPRTPRITIDVEKALQDNPLWEEKENEPPVPDIIADSPTEK